MVIIMITIKVEKLTKNAFAPFGEFYKMDNPDGYALQGEIHSFYPDRITASQGRNVAYSSLVVRKPERIIVKQVEYHTTTCELILPLNDNMIIHVAQPSCGKPIPDETHAFLVPKNTLVKLKECVWHLAPIPANKDELFAMIILPACTYINDCKVVDLKENEQFEIIK